MLCQHCDFSVRSLCTVASASRASFDLSALMYEVIIWYVFYWSLELSLRYSSFTYWSENFAAKQISYAVWMKAPRSLQSQRGILSWVVSRIFKLCSPRKWDLSEDFSTEHYMNILLNSTWIESEEMRQEAWALKKMRKKFSACLLSSRAFQQHIIIIESMNGIKFFVLKVHLKETS